MAERTAEKFELPLSIGLSDIDELGHVNNVVYLRWVQDAAVAHWRAAAPPQAQKELLWVVARHEIDYKRAAMPEDRIIAVTWIGQAFGLKFERHTEILRASDRKLLARALTHWVPVNPATMRPTEVSSDVRALFSVPPAGSV